jgi:SPP1 family predicted phage head-tail adaptor
VNGNPGIGELRDRVTFSSPSSTLDDFGQQVEAFSNSVTVWANVKQREVTETQVAEGTVANARLEIIIRALSSITTRSKVLFMGNSHNVTAITHTDIYRTHMRVLAERRV